MLHETICNNDCQRSTALQHCCHIVSNSDNTRELKQRRTSTGNGLFAQFSRDFEQIFGQIVSIRIKTLGNINTVA